MVPHESNSVFEQNGSVHTVPQDVAQLPTIQEADRRVSHAQAISVFVPAALVAITG
jgi:hypothetical protein